MDGQGPVGPPANAPDTMASTPAIAGCQLLAAIGRGATGVVYRARQIDMDRQVAIKVLHRHLAEHPGVAARFRREAAASGRISHPHVVKVHDAGADQGRLFLIMEYMPGGDAVRLASATHGRLTYRRAVEIVADAADGLFAIHQAGLIHRDVKPGNILIGSDGTAKISDLGFAHDGTPGSQASQGTPLGTPGFMSPEQAEDISIVDARTDIYALGASLYRLIIGRPPYTGSSPWATVASVLRDPFPDPLDAAGDMPYPLALAILRACAKDRDNRYPTADAMRQDLHRLLRDGVPDCLAGSRVKESRVQVAWSDIATSVDTLATRRVPDRPRPQRPRLHPRLRTTLIVVVATMVVAACFVAIWKGLSRPALPTPPQPVESERPVPQRPVSTPVRAQPERPAGARPVTPQRPEALPDRPRPPRTSLPSQRIQPRPAPQTPAVERPIIPVPPPDLAAIEQVEHGWPADVPGGLATSDGAADLARQMVLAAGGSDDPIERYAFHQYAAICYIRSGDPSQASLQVAELTRRFTITSAEAWSRIFDRLIAIGLPDRDRERLLLWLSVQTDAELERAGDLTINAMLQGMERCGHQASVAETRTHLDDRLSALARLRDARRRIETDPHDAEAHLVVAEDLVRRQGITPEVLPLLSRGADASLAAAATQELGSDGSLASRLETYHRWSTATATARPTWAAAIVPHAQALGTVLLTEVGGLDRVRVERAQEKLQQQAARLPEAPLPPLIHPEELVNIRALLPMQQHHHVESVVSARIQGYLDAIRTPQQYDHAMQALVALGDLTKVYRTGTGGTNDPHRAMTQITSRWVGNATSIVELVRRYKLVEERHDVSRFTVKDIMSSYISRHGITTATDVRKIAHELSALTGNTTFLGLAGSAP